MTCSEHSGVVARIEAVEKKAEKTDERFYHILISTVLTLITTLATGATVMYSSISAKADRAIEANQKMEIAQALEEIQEYKRKILLAGTEKNGNPIGYNDSVVE